MTYLEKITYLTGNFLQVSQFALKNAYRVIALSEGKSRETHYFSGDMTQVEACEAIAREYLHKGLNLSGAELADFFSKHQGLSVKDYNNLKKMLLKRDYIVSLFYIENSSQLAREEVAIYESKINELQEYVDLASKLNVSLSKACDRLYDMF